MCKTGENKLTIQTHRQRTPFSPTCYDIMDFYLQHFDCYFTPRTISLSLDKPQSTISDCINLLKKNSYLSKVTETGTAYHITVENMEFWRTDFKNHILSEHEEPHT